MKEDAASPQSPLVKQASFLSQHILALPFFNSPWSSLLASQTDKALSQPNWTRKSYTQLLVNRHMTLFFHLKLVKSLEAFASISMKQARHRPDTGSSPCSPKSLLGLCFFIICFLHLFLGRSFPFIFAPRSNEGERGIVDS